MNNETQRIIDTIPAEWTNVINYINKKKDTYGFEIEKDDSQIIIHDINCGRKQYMVSIDLKLGEIGFIDDLVSYQKLVDSGWSIDKDLWSKDLNRLKSKFNDRGYEISWASRGNGNYDWYELNTKAMNFYEEDLIELTELWESFNDYKADELNLN